MNIFNKKTILFFSIASLMLNGCVAKNEFERKSPSKVMAGTKLQNIKPTWGKLNIKKKDSSKEDCIDCYATLIDYSKAPSSSNPILTKVVTKQIIKTYKRNKVAENKAFGDYGYKETASDTTIKRNSYINRKLVSAPATINTSYSSYSTDTAIQVGAFSKYAGAKRYFKKYNALSDKYKVTIKTGTKNKKPLHRVRIEGFKNKSEAKKFMYSYGIKDAFVVRK